MSPAVSVVMPIFNESATIAGSVQQVLALLRPSDELILVDGESVDDSLDKVAQVISSRQPDQALVRVLSARKGRANQMNAGARAAQGDVLLFLHADTSLSQSAWTELLTCLDHVRAGVRFWGRFDVRIVGKSMWLPVIGWFMNRRSRLSRIATGDQCLFLTRSLFNRIGGYFDQPLMEDIELCKTLKTQPDALFLPLSGPVLTSGRRWDEQGAWRTILLMWRFRFMYWRGANAYDLARKYRDVRSQMSHEDRAASNLAGLTSEAEANKAATEKAT